ADPEIQFFFLSLEYLVIPWIPGILLCFSLEFGGYEKYCTRESYLIIFIIPAITFISFFTNNIFHLYYESFTYVEIQNLTIPAFVPGIMYRVLNISIIVPQIFCFLILFRIFLKSPRIFKPQMAIIVICMVLGILSFVFFFLISKPFQNFDPQPIFLAIINLLVLIAIFRLQFFDLIHIPYHSIFENLEEGIIVLDAHNRIIRINKKASILLEIEPDTVTGDDLNSISSFLTSYHDKLTGNSYTNIRIESRIKNDEVSLLIDMYPVFDSSSRLQSRMIILRDITEITRTSQALSKAGEKLNLLNSITRHDILNQVAIISGYGSMMTECIHDNTRCHTQLERINDASDSVKKLIKFTAEYQDLGISKPVWLHISDVVAKARNTLHPPDSVSLQINTDLILFADMLLEKVFFNLMDNSLRHGTSVTRIMISSYQVENGYVLVYEDNGGGVEPEYKKRIFSRGFGKNTGYGLFLVREILSITSITIHETGVYGSGVRFEMTIPPHAVKTTGVPIPHPLKNGITYDTSPS
ncbi:MAG: histidine kinase N-terminal 7TM domain-containing protein, partial [Methanobacteriota archaeon]